MSRKRVRRYLGSWPGFLQMGRKVYAVDDAIEVDEYDGFEIIRRRVLLDDVLMVTYHRFRGVAFVATTGAFGLLFSFFSAVIAWDGERVAATIVFILCALPPLLAAAHRLVFGVDVVTVFGRRTTARMRFRIRKRLAERVHDDVVSMVRRAQAAGLAD